MNETKRKAIGEALNDIHAAGGRVWDDFRDPRAVVRWMRGDDVELHPDDLARLHRAGLTESESEE